MTGRAAPEPRGDVTDRLTCHYELRCRPGESAEHKARGIALEQTVELPDAVLSDAIRESIVGRVERLEQHSTRRWHAVISYPAGIVAGEWPALLNLLYGNISLKPGILLTDIDWPAALLEQFGGPAFGVAGLRELLGAPARGLCATALKPVGASTAALAALAGEFAAGGIDIVKDDHSLTDQQWSRFHDRVDACQRAVARANATHGGRTLYFPNVTAAPTQFAERLAIAGAAGCRGVLVNPWLIGLDSIAQARDAGFAVMAHPSLSGALLGHTRGLSAELLFGDLMRLAGADAVIYTNAGGRFEFPLARCQRINDRLRRPWGLIRPAFAVPAGGIDSARARHWIRQHGRDTILLVGSSLYQQPDRRAAAAGLRHATESTQ